MSQLIVIMQGDSGRHAALFPLATLAIPCVTDHQPTDPPCAIQKILDQTCSCFKCAPRDGLALL